MSYSSMEDVNPAIRGIDPPVTLAQANMIADWADKIEDVESPWAVAISNFKKAYIVRDGRWAKRAAEVDMGELNEAVTKSVSGKDLPAASFLVVGDSEEVGTWHLPVKDAAGKPDHRLMGGAFAALTKGYRGQKYAGPNKAEALRKLKALYKAEDMPIPGAAELGEHEEDVEKEAFREAPLHASSFSDVDAAAKAQETMDKLRVRIGQFNALMDNLMWNEEVKDKAAAIRSLTEEFVGLLPASLKPTSEREAEEMELETVKLAETFASVELLTKGIAEADAGGPMTMKAQPIEPGFGNARDNNYYPAEMLQRDARKFIGAKMHESDHKDDKSTRTWVSTITDVLGFSDTGAPVCEVVVHDPDFAQRVRNLAEENLLDKMECSILGDGKFRKGEIDGKKANIVEALTRITDVDWVTRAGAGGKALSISESGGDGMGEEKKDVTLDEGAPTKEPKEEVLTETPQQEKPLDEKAVAGILAETNLPESAKTYLAESEYGDEAALNEAVTKHIEYLKAVTGSGKPFGHEGGTETQMSDEDYDKRYDGIMESHSVRRFGN